SDLTHLIITSQTGCLNQTDQHPVVNIFQAGPSFLESDVDEQLLIHIPFNQPVKLHSMRILSGPGVNDQGRAPKTIKLFANRPNLGFDEVDSVHETQLIELTEEDYESDNLINLRYVRFQNVAHLVVFIQDNLEDEDTTALSRIVFYGKRTNAESTQAQDNMVPRAQ
ncbi:thioredoxin-like 1, isoform CRA_b, partial [Dimargaris cristalligena]